MTTFLLIGDVHAVPAELEDCRRLSVLVERVLADHPVARPVLMGDQHHSHGVIHLATLAYWRDVLRAWGGAEKVIALVGNHDKGARDNPEHGRTAMDAYRDLALVASPRVDVGGVAFVSHFPDPQEFLASCKAAGSSWNANTTLVCHQTFLGCEEDGRPLQDGIDPALVPYEQIVSGHIHQGQSFGKVWYVGAPRWRTLTDAASPERAIWLVEVDGAGRIVSRAAVQTNGTCRAIRSAEDSPEHPLDIAQLTDGSDWRVEVRGPAAYVHRRRQELAAMGAKVRAVPTDQTPVKVRESEGVEASLLRYAQEFKAPRGTGTEKLLARLNGLLEVST